MTDKDNRLDLALNRLHSIANKQSSSSSPSSLSSSSGTTGGNQITKLLDFKGKTDAVDEASDCNSTNEKQNDQNLEPDIDAIKMFVGQIPRDWGEADCRKLLIEFGDIHSLNILRDKRTGISRGCCFVTYFARRSALEAQNALHNIRVLPGMHHPIQMKPADSENRNERKLFVGMLARKYTEVDVCKLFSAYGTIEECTILRDSNGQSKGCAFVTFASRSNAISAIKATNHSLTLEGCTSPLVVKFADTQKEKDARKQQQQLVQQLWAAVAHPNSVAASNYTHTWNLERQSTGSLPVCPIIFDATTNQSLMSMASNAATQQQQLAAASLALQQQIQQQLVQSVNNADSVALTAATLAPVLAALCGNTANNNCNQLQPVTLNNNGAFNSLNLAQVKNRLLRPETLQSSFTNSISPVAALTKLNTNAVSNAQFALTAACPQANKPLQGPDGCNLFIYHLPAEYTDHDLTQAFASFGTIISSKVFIDKNTNLSKCFGFVSFDNPLSAQSAIQAMEGFKIGNKRLKVQLKKSKNKPY